MEKFLSDILPSNIEGILEDITLISLKLIALMILGYYLSRFFAKKIKKGLQERDIVLANFLSQVVFIGINIVVIIAALGTIGVQINSIIAVLGTAGVAIALGLKDSLSSVASGIILIILRPFSPGDTIELGSLTGKVEAINLFNTTLRLPDGKLAIIPNSNIASANVINSTDITQRRLDIVFGVGYDSDIEKVKSIAVSVLESVPCVDSKKGYFVGLSDMASSSLNFIIRFWIGIEHGTVQSKAQVLEALKESLDKNGIEIPFDKLDVTLYESTPSSHKSTKLQ
ncbi:mechanosensitive ion channel family protein [Helicobacter sp. 23-1048]